MHTSPTAHPTKTKKSALKATPEVEDFAHKYTEEGQGKVGGKLIDNYFRNVHNLVERSGATNRAHPKAIEIGCGEGFSTQRLRDMLPENVELHASEYVDHMIPKAKANNPGVTVTQESVYETKHADNTFDIIFLLEVLEHLDFPDQALAELRRILKKDGVLILGVPREPLWCGLNMARGKYIKRLGNTPGHLNHWSTSSLRKFVQDYFGPVHDTRTPLPWTIVLAQKET